MMCRPANRELVESEKVCIAALKKWLNIEASIYKQNSRIKWLQDGYENSNYFHAHMKARSSRNRIDKLRN